MVELGVLGFLLIYFLRFYLAIFAFRQVFLLRTRFHRAMATAALLLFLVAIPGGVVFDVISDVYYWFFAGLLMLVIRLDGETVKAVARAWTAMPAEAAGPAMPSPVNRETA
jgi:hypothetical protein